MKVLDKSILDYTLEEFQDMEYFGSGELFNAIILVPTKDVHDSGYRCMAGILERNDDIVGKVGGGCDVVNPNGVGNYGPFDPAIFSKMINSRSVPYMGLSMDCLPKSNCIRLMLSGLWRMDDFIGSYLTFYKVDEGDKE